MSGRGATVCDLTIILRTRLLCGLYNHRAVPPSYRTLAKLYCVTVTAVTLAFSITLSTHYLWEGPSSLRNYPLYSLQCILVIASLYSGDEYIYRYFTINALTDITLDSPRVFRRLEKQMNKKYITGVVLAIVFFILRVVVYKYYDVNIFIKALISAAIDQIFGSSCSGKLAIVQLFDARLLVLKRRLQRYGFRTVGRARAQPYTEIYHEILQELDAANNPLKLLLFFDLTANCCNLIAVMASYFLFGSESQNMDAFDLIGNILVGALALIFRFALSFGHVVYLESAAAHCDEMAIFTATQLIKNPTAPERQRMRDFLAALERRGASYRVLRALPLNARKVLSVLGFCSANAIILIQSLRNANN